MAVITANPVANTTTDIPQLSIGNNMAELTASDITTALAALLNMQDVNEVKRDVFEAAGEIKVRVGEASTANQISILQAQIANMQGQAGLASDVAKGSTEVALGLGVVNTNVSNQAGILGVNVVNATSKTDNLVSTATNLINTNLLAGNYTTQSIIRDEAEKTRALITSINVADLNRQIVISENKLAEALGDARSAAAGVVVNQTVNQAQAQAQQQQQFTALNNGINSLYGEIQVAKTSIVNLGTMTGNNQSSTAVRTWDKPVYLIDKAINNPKIKLKNGLVLLRG